MKISIDTLPLWDAFKQSDICPFCHIEIRLEALFIETYLGDSVMEPDTRIAVNATGFCREHFRLLYQQKSSKLGLALMAHTHLKETMKTVQADMESLESACCEGGSLIKRAAGARDFNQELDRIADAACERTKSCVVCRRVEGHMQRYHETALHMWEHDSDFKKLFGQCGGFCVPHWARQLKACKGVLPTKKTAEFITNLNGMEKDSLAALEKDLEWFTRKFDYRNTDKPWGNSKDALTRALNTLEGYIVKSDS